MNGNDSQVSAGVFQMRVFGQALQLRGGRMTQRVGGGLQIGREDGRHAFEHLHRQRGG